LNYTRDNRCSVFMRVNFCQVLSNSQF